MNQKRKERLFKCFGEDLIEVRKMTAEQIFEKTGYKNSATLNSILSVMVQEKNAVKISPGVYKLVSEKKDETREIPEKTEEIVLVIPKDDKRSVEELEGFISESEKDCLKLEKEEEKLLKNIEELQNDIKEKQELKKEVVKEILIAKKLIEERYSKIKEAVGLLKLFIEEKGFKPKDILENPDVLIENRIV